MAKEKDFIQVFEDFKDTDVWKKMCEYLDGRVETRTKVLQGLTGDMGIDFDTRYSTHDLMRSEIRFIELIMKKIPDEIIREELNKKQQEEEQKLVDAQAEINALSDMVS